VKADPSGRTCALDSSVSSAFVELMCWSRCVYVSSGRKHGGGVVIQMSVKKRERIHGPACAQGQQAQNHSVGHKPPHKQMRTNNVARTEPLYQPRVRLGDLVVGLLQRVLAEAHHQHELCLVGAADHRREHRLELWDQCVANPRREHVVRFEVPGRLRASVCACVRARVARMHAV
jgi:hypothetical protein